MDMCYDCTSSRTRSRALDLHWVPSSYTHVVPMKGSRINLLRSWKFLQFTSHVQDKEPGTVSEPVAGRQCSFIAFPKTNTKVQCLSLETYWREWAFGRCPTVPGATRLWYHLMDFGPPEYLRANTHSVSV